MPVVMLSSSNSQPEIDLAYSLGANASFKKPMTLSAYIDLIQVLTKYWLDLAQLPSPSNRFLSSVDAVDVESGQHGESREDS